MARSYELILTDDVDKTSTASATEVIGFGGFIHMIDLTEEHQAELRADIEKWTQYAHSKVKWTKRTQPKFGTSLIQDDKTQVAPAAKKKTPRRIATTPQERAEMRSWGRENGWEVAERGYPSAALIRAYRKAQRNA